MRSLSVFIATLISLILLGAPTAFARSTVATSSLPQGIHVQPFEFLGVNPCNGENVAVTAWFIVDGKFTQDGAGGMHSLSVSQLHGTGVGEVTGSKYVVRDTAFTTDNITAGGVVNVNLPITGFFRALDNDVPDLVYFAFFHITVNANGDLTSSVEKFEFLCQ